MVPGDHRQGARDQLLQADRRRRAEIQRSGKPQAGDQHVEEVSSVYGLVEKAALGDIAAMARLAKRDPVRQAVFDATRSIMEDLAREISLCLRYYSVTFRGHRPNRVRLVGGEANDPQLQSILNTALPIPAEAGRLMSSVKLDRMKPADRRGSLSEWSVALKPGLCTTTGRFGSAGRCAKVVPRGIADAAGGSSRSQPRDQSRRRASESRASESRAGGAESGEKRTPARSDAQAVGAPCVKWNSSRIGIPRSDGAGAWSCCKAGRRCW